MERQTKQRITGVIVAIIILAVILLLLFVGSEPSTPPVDSLNQSQPIAAVNTAQQVWVVQIGSFTTKSHATALVKKLQQAGFNSYLNEVVTNNATYYRVFAGNEINKQNADDLKQKLQDNLQLTGIIVKK